MIRRVCRLGLARSATLAALLLAIVPPPRADAQEQPRVLLTATPDLPPELERVLRAELDSLGFSMEAGEPAEDLDTQAREARVAFAVALRGEGERVRVVILDLITDKRVERLSAASFAESRDLAIEVVELTRASLLELGTPRFEDAVVPPAARALAEAPVRPATVFLSLGPLLAWSPGGLDPSAHALVRVAATLAPSWSLALDLDLPTVPTWLTAGEGRASQILSMALVSVRFEPTADSEVVGARFALGTGGAWLHSEGETRTPGLRGTSSDGGSWLVSASASVGLRVSPRVAFWLDAIGMVGIPELGLSFAGRRAATWGRPVIAASLMLEVALD
jgi:hypothetical protein